MTRSVTLLELRTRALAAADLPQYTNSSWCTPSELNLLINDSGTDLHDQLVMAWGDYFLKMAPVTISAGNSSYTLPTDFFKLRSVLLISGSDRIQLLPFTESERAALYNSQTSVPKYKLEDGNLILLPAVVSGSVELRYIYQYPWLNADTDTLSYNIISGWDAFIVYDVAAKLRVKQKQDASSLAAMCDRFKARIANASSEREASGRRRVGDVYGFSVMRNSYGDD